MTRYNDTQIEEMRKLITNKKVIELEYDDEDDYFVLMFEGGFEMCFRYMADLVDD